MWGEGRRWWRCMGGGLGVGLMVVWVVRVCLILTITLLMLLVSLLLKNRITLQEADASIPVQANVYAFKEALEASVGVSGDSGKSSVKVLPGCPSTPPHLVGEVKVEESVTVKEAEARHGASVKYGGFSWPEHCEARWSVAIIVPYRDREHQVGAFLNHMHPFLQRQQLNYSIYFVEQDGTELFNRARLLNVGFLESHKEGPWDCYAFHDVDMLPENDYHLYHCSAQPRHLAVATSNNKYRSSHGILYHTYYGGACLMGEGHIRKVNGWSNIYWGWGGEDDDMWRRITFADMAVWRYPAHFAKYKMIKHKRQIVNEDRYKILKRNTGRYPYDGLKNLNYTIKTVTRHPLYTHILVDIGSSSAQDDPTNKKFSGHNNKKT
ncbi:beta-1,4-galactosyltransferase 4-like [Homarus americanus]|uniref:Beta-1,4-N-acetylgalactosaminyltransferase n=1 Tax=Homarus americanus TaxID=6706 RepID=A0A8J5K3J6_HOMAM|nr:beta-1,4-galactosyltransferase 4-like [Homarus americanus]KAG7164244.1 Beta-1-4-galactosyltransferase 4-like [Homarus americanus]